MVDNWRYRVMLLPLHAVSSRKELELSTAPYNTSLIFAFDAQAESGFGNISTFHDRSGNGRDLIQNNVSNQLELVQAFNNKKYLYADGNNRFMRTGDFGQVFTGMTYFQVVRSVSSANTVLTDEIGSSGARLFTARDQASGGWRTFNGGTVPVNNETTATGDVPVIFDVNLSASMRLRIERGDTGFNAENTSGNSTTGVRSLRIASDRADTRFATAYYGEMLLYNFVMTEAERETVREYLREKWFD